MGLPGSSRLAFTADLEICRLLAGMWQVSGAHEDHERIEAVTSGSRDLFRTIGDCGDEYRR